MLNKMSGNLVSIIPSLSFEGTLPKHTPHFLDYHVKHSHTGVDVTGTALEAEI